MAVKYDLPESCNRCASANRFECSSYEGSILTSTMTVCTACGFVDCWDTGFFDSGSEMESKSDQYWFDAGKMKTAPRESSCNG